eukprot:7030357-Alexandrium_andersonii.AAC.1
MRCKRCPHPGHCSASGPAGPPVSPLHTPHLWGLSSGSASRRSATTYSGPQHAQPAAGPWWSLRVRKQVSRVRRPCVKATPS